MWGLLDIFAFGMDGDDQKGNAGCLVVVIMVAIVLAIQGIMSVFGLPPEPVVEKQPGSGQQIVEEVGEKTGKSLRSFTRGIWKGIRSGGDEH